MAYYSYGRRQEVDNTFWAYLAGFGLILIAIGMIINAMDAAELRDLTNKIAELEPRRVLWFSQQPNAEAEVKQYSGEFAPHWSDGFSAALSESRKNLEDNGLVHELQMKAQKLLQDNDREAARVVWEEADVKLKASEQIITKILGPPTFYSQLQQHSDAVDNGYLDQVQKVINDKYRYVESLPKKNLCGSSNVISYESAILQINQAQDQLDTVARRTLQTVLPEGIIDKPLVFDEAQRVEVMANSAATTADQLSSQADTAATEIATCDANITLAGFELVDADNFVLAQSYYDQAISARTNALISCTTQDFGSVTAFVSSCNSYASLSYSAAQPPPATSVPSSSNDNYSSGGSGSYDPGGSGSYDPGGSDSYDPGGFDSYDSGDGYGGNDGYDSGDGFGGSDGYSSDDGF
jgi:hypothetical protein